MNDLEILNQCFEPDFENGILYLKERPREHFVNDSGYKNHLNRVGQDISSNTKCGYKEIRIHLYGKMYRRYVHRCIYMMYHNVLLKRSQIIDHIDGNVSNNCIDNIRLCTPSQNAFNCGKKNKNVSYEKGRNKPYRVVLKMNGKSHSFGYYSTLEEANKVAHDLREKYHGEFANHGE